MATPRIGLPHQRPRKDSVQRRIAQAEASAKAKTDAELKVDAALAIGHIKLNQPGRRAATLLTGSMAEVTASDMLTILTIGTTVDAQARLTRQGAKACPKERARVTALLRSLIKDLGARARDRDIRVSAFEPEVFASIQPGGKTTSANIVEVDWVAKARSMGLRD